MLYNDPVGSTNTLVLDSTQCPRCMWSRPSASRSWRICCDRGGATAARCAIGHRLQRARAVDVPRSLRAGRLLPRRGTFSSPTSSRPGQTSSPASQTLQHRPQVRLCSAARRCPARTWPASAALFKQLHPEWSPSQIKSALMTTAGRRSSMVPIPMAAGDLRQGAGQFGRTLASNPGLVFDAGFGDWLSFICGTDNSRASYCRRSPIDPSDSTRRPSHRALAGSQTVKRTVTNVGAALRPTRLGPRGSRISRTAQSGVIDDRGRARPRNSASPSRNAARRERLRGGHCTLTDGTATTCAFRSSQARRIRGSGGSQRHV